MILVYKDMVLVCVCVCVCSYLSIIEWRREYMIQHPANYSRYLEKNIPG